MLFTLHILKDFTPVPYDEQNYGKFNVGDSYIVLNTKVIQSNTIFVQLKFQQVGDKFSWDVHFWLGEETTQVDIGTN